MRSFLLLTVIIFFSCSTSNQKPFILKNPDAVQLKKEFLKSDSQLNTVLTYLERSYKATSEKTDIKTDPDFNNAECGFTKKFEFSIEYTLYKCGEAAPMKETITFPKTSLEQLKKWIEDIHASQTEEEVTNVWYKDKNEYGPKDEEVGCYYTIKQTEAQSIISIWCGC
ncbi:MAG: hypothetical protein JXR05_03615 [Flavobacteriaceae bacterium]